MKLDSLFVSAFTFLSLGLALTSGFETSFAATTIRVPADQPTIQAGIDAAVNGDTVLVADGTYTGEGNRNISFKGKAITVRSENGPVACIIDCENYHGSINDYGFIFNSHENETSVLSGITVKNSFNDGIWCGYYYSSPMINNCIVTGNAGVGIFCGSSTRITGCTISGNGSFGIYCFTNSPIITNCTVSGNANDGIWCNSGSPTITSCTVTGNSGTGIYSWEGSPTITSCTISENVKSGIYCKSGSPTIENCILKGNQTPDQGGGVYLYSCISAKLINLLVVGNTAYGRGGGVSSSSSSFLRITNCTISGNITNYGGGVYLDSSSDEIKNAIIWGNTPDTNSMSSSTIVSHSDIAGYSGAGTGNIDSDPLFIGSGNYHLSSGSPCINSGTSSGAPDTDIEGTSRPQGSGYDIGAYEFFFVPPCPNCSGTAVIIAGINFPCRTCECIGTESITIGSGVTIPSGASVTFKAPIIKVLPGFHAEAGAVVNMRQE